MPQVIDLLDAASIGRLCVWLDQVASLAALMRERPAPGRGGGQDDDTTTERKTT